MNVIDIVILVVLAGFLVKGLIRGLLKEICSLLGLLAGAVLAFCFHVPLAELLAEDLHFSPSIATAAAFLALFLTTLLFFVLLGYLLSRFVKLIFLGGLNRVAGGFFGLAQGVLLLALILFALSLRPLPRFLQAAVTGSELSVPFVRLGEATFHGSCRVFPLHRVS